MNIKIITVIATVGFIAGVVFTAVQAKKDPEPLPLRQPATKPYKHSIAGMGIVESYRENINVAPYWPGKIVKIYVKEGQQVKSGDPLYKLDTTELKAQLKSLKAQADATQAKLTRMKHEPRTEDIPPLEALVAQTEANYKNIESQLKKMESVTDPRAISLDSLDRKKFELEIAKANMQKAKADLERLKAGAWSYDIEQVSKEYSSLLSKADEVKILIKQATIRAPRDGEILKIYNRVGEYVNVVSNTPPVLLGTTETMQIRVDIDEVNASNVKPNMKAKAFLKGDQKKSFPLKFVRIQPYMVPKKNLSGLSTERVDVRVLQLIYEFDPPDFPVYVGQQVDVYLDNS